MGRRPFPGEADTGIKMTGFIVAIVVSLLLCNVLARVAPALGLIDRPGGHRDHEVETPLVGGLAMYTAFVLASLLFLDVAEMRGLLIGGGLLVLIGALDDRYELATSVRFITQILAAMSIVYFDGAQLMDLGRLFTDHVLLLGRWSVLMTVFAVVGVINAINMSDGIDGLAGMLVCVTLGFLLVLLPAQDGGMTLTLLGAVIGFLVWNLRIGRLRAALFMGDAGSMFLGLCVAWLLITGSQGELRSFTPITALWLLALPLWDTVAALLTRPLLGGSPFTPDRFHYHHVLMAHGLGVNTTLALSTVCAVCVALGGTTAYWKGIPEYTMFYWFLAIFIVYCVFIFMRRREEQGGE